MEQNIALKKTYSDTYAINIDDYFKYIFKKTEKIVCTVLYIVRLEHTLADDPIIKDIEASSFNVLNTALETLKTTDRTRMKGSMELKFALVTLESKLRVMHAAGLLVPEYLEVFLHELDTVQRSLRKYTETPHMNPMIREEQHRALPQSRVRTPKQRTTVMREPQTSPNGESVKSRRERVLDVLRERGEATIKDISDIIKDCSEKTIQRELISLIEENIIVREGERRWSKYKLS